MRKMQQSAKEIIRVLQLVPHPEGGFYRETFRDAAQNPQGRAASTLIYFLLTAGQISKWHRVDAVEIWHYYAGAALELTIVEKDDLRQTHILGMDLDAGQAPQAIVPLNAWQRAVCLGTADSWTLVGCTVSPGFEFSGFELAPDGFEP